MGTLSLLSQALKHYHISISYSFREGGRGTGTGQDPHKTQPATGRRHAHLGPQEALREEHDLTDLLQVRHNDNHRPEQRLHRLRQLCAARIAGIHRDEDTHPRVKGDLLPFKLGDGREKRE